MAEIIGGKYESYSASPRNLLHNITTNAPNQVDEHLLTIGRQKLRKWLGRVVRVIITDGRELIGFFNCTDRDANIVLSMCTEYLIEGKDARLLGNVMVPGRHILSLSVDLPNEV